MDLNGLSEPEYALALRLEELLRHPQYPALVEFVEAHMHRNYDAMESKPAMLHYYAGGGDALRRLGADITALIAKKNRAVAEAATAGADDIDDGKLEWKDFGGRTAPQAIS